MTPLNRPRSRVHAFAFAWLLAGAMATPGCGSPASGTVTYAPVLDAKISQDGEPQLLQDVDAAPADLPAADLIEADATEAAVCPGGARCPCGPDAECDGGICLETSNGHVCAAPCSGSAACKATEVCTAYATAGGDLVSVCVPRWVSLCAPCLSHQDCQPGIATGEPKCYDQGASGSFCSAPCSDKVPCPSGFECQGASPHCVPAGGAVCPCSGWAAQHGSTTQCTQTNDSGTCKAARTCDKPGSLPACLAQAATLETCNAKDDDCDGMTDDNADGACDDGSPCTADFCQGGSCSHPPSVVCGDGMCATQCGEDPQACSVDCHKCGDGVCAPGEGPSSCPNDCCGFCGDGKCVGYACGEDPGGAKPCPLDCGAACGNGTCDKGENPGNCAADCQKQLCGNHVCEPIDGGPKACPQDCAASCGNCICEKSEDFMSCPNDCGSCGDDLCSVCFTAGESQMTCPSDCGDLKLIGCTTMWAMFCSDDTNCTDDACQQGKGCVHLPVEGTCTDDSACTVGDACAGGACLPGAPTVCDDANACTKDSCAPDIGCIFAKIDTVSCVDGDACTVGDACLDGICVPGSPVSCGDGNACTDDGCDAAVGCAYAHINADCSDGNACTVDDGCVGGVCLPGAVTSCDDGNACTFDACESAAGCFHVVQPGLACSDGDACTLGDVCVGAQCESGAAANCDDGNACTDDSCDVIDGLCGHAVHAAACDDGNACTALDACMAALCSGVTLDCDDGDACTDDTCSSATGCKHDSNATGCADGNICTDDSCDPASGCLFKPNSAPCNDGNACTDDSCDAASGCVALANAVTCSDGDACTHEDTCVAALCVGQTVVCDDGNLCTDDSCDTTLGCVALANAVTCSDANACTSDDACAASLCVGQTVDCDDGNQCTDDGCAPSSGCLAVASEAGCDDGDACTASETCVGGVCTASAGLDCDDKNECSTDACDHVAGCTHTAHVGACSDCDACTLDDQCSLGLCVPGALKTCDDGNSCTSSACDAELGCTLNPLPGGGCNDGNACTTADKCSAQGKCVGVAKSCDDSLACTDDACDVGTGCHHAGKDSKCDDGVACTTDSCNTASGCTYANNKERCDDFSACTGDYCAGESGCVHTDLCNDGMACTVDSCASKKESCVHTVSCNDNNNCTSDGCSAAGACTYTTFKNGTSCGTNKTCQNGVCK